MGKVRKSKNKGFDCEDASSAERSSKSNSCERSNGSAVASLRKSRKSCGCTRGSALLIALSSVSLLAAFLVTVRGQRFRISRISFYSLNAAALDHDSPYDASRILRFGNAQTRNQTERKHGTPSQTPEVEWLQYPAIANETEHVLGHLREAAAAARRRTPCHLAVTDHAHVFGLPTSTPLRLSTGAIHELQIVSLDGDGRIRCGGGDYYETDLSSAYWKSRPPVTDLRNGTYRVRLQVDSRFAGVYVFTVILAYPNFHGLDWTPVRTISPWYRNLTVLKIQIEFFTPSATAPHADLARCTGSSFDSNRWSGRWTREQFKEACTSERSGSGRFLCLDLDTGCERPWCEGPVGRLESNGWVYSAHCSFKLLTRDEAWDCLHGKWLFWWGDSNHEDTTRNLLTFVLGVTAGPEMPRIYDRVYKRPDGPPTPKPGTLVNRSTDPLRFGSREETMATSATPVGRQQYVRITMIFNGHFNAAYNNLGLYSLTDPTFRKSIEAYFDKSKGPAVPDVVVLNSGLHDALFWNTTEQFVARGVEMAAQFWQRILEGILPRNPTVIYRHTVASAGGFRAYPNNPHKLEVYTRLLGDRLAKLNLSNFKIVDHFDVTFPWHFDHSCSDGLHYGRPPVQNPSMDERLRRHYFVDLMLVHILLNVMCFD